MPKITRFTSNSGGHETALLKITQNGVETEYEPFGNDVDIEVDSVEEAKSPLKFEDGVLSNGGTDLNVRGNKCWAEGETTTAGPGTAAHAEGHETAASNDYSHSEGMSTTASGIAAHAEGRSTRATAQYSHAEGQDTLASGPASHAGGKGTKVGVEGGTAVGKYNSDFGALFVVGDGTGDNSRSDAFKVDANGDTWVKINNVLTKVINVSGGGSGPVYVQESHTSSDSNVTVTSQKTTCTFDSNLNDFTGELHVRFQNSGQASTVALYVNDEYNDKIVSTLPVMSGMTHLMVPVSVKSGSLRAEVTFATASTPSSVKFDLLGYNLVASGGGSGGDGVSMYYHEGGAWYDANDAEVDIQDIIDATDGGAAPIVVQMRGGGSKDSYYLVEYSPSNYIVLSNGSRVLTLDGTDETYSFDDSIETTVEAVEKITEDLDRKITTTYPFAQITTMSDFAGFGVTSTTRMIGQLFAVPIASEIRKDETLLCVNALQNFSGKVSFGIFEYDFDANNGTGSTYWIADTGTVSVQAGENEFLLRHVNNDVHELKSSKLYYAVVAIASDASASGLMLASSPNYAANYNANPKYTLLVSNMDNYIDWTTGELSGAWFQGYNEDNTIPRLFMMLRNGEGSAPIPVTEPFIDIGTFTLQHQYRVSDIFSLTPSAEGGVYRKVIPAQDVDIISFRYVDYHGSVGSQSSFPVLLDDTYTPMKTIGDGSWTLGDSDQTKIDSSHYVHEFTFSTPVHLTANTAYWFLVGGNLSNQGNDWLITYQSPSVVNDLLLVKSMYNVSQWIIPSDGEFQSQQPGMYLRLNDGINSWVI